MKKNYTILIILFITLTLAGLAGIQLYWIRSAVSLRESHFKRSVSEAVTNSINKLEKIEVANTIRNRVYGTKHDATIFTTLDSINSLFNKEMEKMLSFYTTEGNEEGNYSPEKISVTLSEYEFEKSVKYLDTNAVDVNTTPETEVLSVIPEIKFDSTEKQLPIDFYDSISNQINQFLKKTFIVSDVFEDMFCLRQYQKLESRINFKMLDSILTQELSNKGINTFFEYGIYNSVHNKLTYQRTGHFKDQLLKEGYPFNLFPSDLFVTPEYFLIYFPYQKSYVLTSIWAMLLVSVFMIILVIVSFFYIIRTIIKQRRLAEMKNDFINNMTHEFKTPVSTISLACEALSDKQIEKSPELYSTIISIISEENKRLGAIAENVLQTALIDKGKITFKYTEVGVHELLQKCISNFMLQFKRQNAQVRFAPGASRDLIWGDAEHLRNTFNNLIDNALKYTADAPKIVISTQQQNDGIEISVKDNGIGISKSNQKKIFEKLFRVHMGNLHNVKGFGLGLNYVKTIVEKHSGNVTVESELKKGSIFRVYLPFGIPPDTNQSENS